MKGGARVNSGPPPDPNALRRERPSDKAGWTILPASGYSGEIPEWPLMPDVMLTARRDVALANAERLADELADETDGRKRAAIRKKLNQATETVTILDRRLDAQRDLEVRLWTDLWRLPQATIWIQLGWTRDVAQYVRHKTVAELGSLDDAKEARQWSDRLGLNPTAMLRNRWKVGDIAPAPAAKQTEKAAPKRRSARARMKVIDGDGGA